MDLANLTLDELKAQLALVDKTQAPYEALELMNAIGRREAEAGVLPDEDRSLKAAVTAVRRSPWAALLGIVVFGITAHLYPPDDRFVVATVIIALLSALAMIHFWLTQKKIYFYLGTLLPLFVTHFVDVGIRPLIQYAALFAGVYATVVFVFRDRILTVLASSDCGAPAGPGVGVQKRNAAR